jgi:CheY-like chemotaxis protein
MLRQVIGEDIHLDFSLQEQMPAVEGDAGSLEQVLVNLAVNARDAMTNGGRLQIATERVVGRGSEYVRLSVKDDGCGIPPEVQPHIFEPFFTTKEPGKGTGMGLSTAFGIVQQHRGWIEVESRVGVGTAFHIFLPMAAGSPAVAPIVTGRESQPARAGATLLVVEDEQTVRNLAVTALTMRGFRVLAAGSGRQALDVWHRESGVIDLIVTDIVMPDRMTGLELAQAIRAENATVPIIFTSGYNEDIVRRGFVPPAHSRFLPKPYSVKTLTAAIGDLLSAEAAGVKVDNLRASL